MTTETWTVLAVVLLPCLAIAWIVADGVMECRKVRKPAKGWNARNGRRAG